MNRLTFALHCPVDGYRIGSVPVSLLWTGSVRHIPEDPEELGGLSYLPCAKCKSEGRPQWQRFEIMPSNPAIKITVPVRFDDLEASA